MAKVMPMDISFYTILYSSTTFHHRGLGRLYAAIKRLLVGQQPIKVLLLVLLVLKVNLVIDNGSYRTTPNKLTR